MPSRNKLLVALGKNLRTRRESAGLTQEQLGDKAGLDPTYISGIERGVRNPSLLSIERLARALGAFVSKIVVDCDNKSNLVSWFDNAVLQSHRFGKSMGRKNWSRDELILAINLYCKTQFGRLHNRNPDIIKLAKLIGRSPSALAWKLVNFASLDPSLKRRGIKGAVNVSHLDREIWEEFYSDWDRLAYESEVLRAKRLGEPIESVVEIDPMELPRSGQDRKAFVKVRVNQSFFRATVLAAYEFQCCITGLAIPDLLNASHIIPWSKDEKHRVNPRNGLCLNAIHDRAFDRGLLTITAEYKVRISTSIGKSSGRNDAVQHLLTRYDGEKIRLPRKFLPDQSFLEYHNKEVFKQ